MMKTLSVVAVVVLAGAHPTFAQSIIKCPGGPPTSAAQISQDACQQASDIYMYMVPQLGAAIAGGNATLGQGGSLGGLGHFTVGLRLNAVSGGIPQVQELPPRVTGAAPARQFPVNDVPIPMPIVDASVGIYKGFPLGLTNVGGVDVLVSASYIPDVSHDGVSLDPDTPLRLGYGIRISALQESIVVPGLSFTWIKRDLPSMSITAIAGNDSLRVEDLELQTSAWRFVASKSLVMFGVALGIGVDRYRTAANVSASVPTAIGVQNSGDLAQSVDLNRTSMFADVSFNLPFFKIVGEVGQVMAGNLSQPTYNTFEGKGALDARIYGSLGFRFGW